MLEEIFVVILVDNGDELLEVPILNTFDQSIMDFCHSIPNLRRGSESLRSGLVI